MLAGIRSRLTYANVISTLCLFMLLGGGAYAALLSRDSVKSKHIVDGQVKEQDVGIGAKFTSHPGVTGAGNGCTPFNGDAWANFTFDNTQSDIGYYRDATGTVRLRGIAIRCNSASTTVFTLPEGYRPGIDQPVPAIYSTGPGSIDLHDGGEVVAHAAQNEWVSLYGVSFRCEPSGLNGCP